MKEAIDDEDYERASKLRDEIRQIEESPRRRLDADAESATNERHDPSGDGRPDGGTRGGSERTSTHNAANGCAAPAPSPISSSAAASAWPATWPTFPSSAGPPSTTAREIENDAPRARPAASQESGELLYVDVDELEGVDRQFLVERQLISREHAESEGARAVAIDRDEQVQPDDQRGGPPADPGDAERPGPASGLGADQPHRRPDREQVTYAFHERLGYLTACPTNVGTGMRVSVMLHLPALVITRQIDKVFRSLQKISLAVRGLYGEGSQAMGDFYQISNQITLGRSEEDLIKQVGDIVPVIIDYERQARDFLDQGKPREPARPGEPGLRHPPHRADDQLRRDDAPALQRADGREPGPDRRPGDSHGQRAVHPHPAGPSAEAHAACELDTADRNIERARYLRRHLNKDATATTTQN